MRNLFRPLALATAAGAALRQVRGHLGAPCPIQQRRQVPLLQSRFRLLLRPRAAGMAAAVARGRRPARRGRRALLQRPWRQGTLCSGSCGSCAGRWLSRHNLYTAPAAACARRWPTLYSRYNGSFAGCARTAPSLHSLCTVASPDCACTFHVFSVTRPLLQIAG
jgi:hypothetical protein